jgi:hypothetical protein
MSKAKETQEKPTAPPRRDAAGRVLDRHGLPLSGPARLSALDVKPNPAAAAREAEQSAGQGPAEQGE